MKGCYSLVGEDIYNRIQLGERGQVDRILDSAHFLPVQPRDVLGYIVAREGRSNVEEGIQLVSAEEGLGESTWYTPLLLHKVVSQWGLVEPSLSSFADSAPALKVELGKCKFKG